MISCSILGGQPAWKLRRGGVPQVVNSETITETGTSAGGHERDEPPVGQPHDAAAGHGEHEIIGALAVDTRRQLDGDKSRERDGPGLVRFRGAQDNPEVSNSGLSLLFNLCCHARLVLSLLSGVLP